ncbi:MAG: YraN family protein [Acidimicrobiales bacterium]
MPAAASDRRRRALGAEGERRAAEWYEAHGYVVVARNWRCRDGEIDVIARDARTVVFCEVKARSGTAFGTPAEAVTAAKQARLRRLAARWLREEGRAAGAGRLLVRFDVATLLGGSLDVLEEAF